MPSSKPKDATAHKQTTLFDVVNSSKAAGTSNLTRSTRGTKKTSSPKRKEAHDDSDSEELTAIRFTPATAPTAPVRDDLESDDDEAPKPLHRKRLLRNKVLDSDGEQPLERKAGRRLLIQSSDEEFQEDRPRKKARLQRGHQPDNISSADDDVADLVHEVDENCMSSDAKRSQF